MHGVHDWNTELPTFSPNYDPRERTAVARLAFESSPMASVATWRSPVLLIHGDDDRNVPFAETEELVEALRREKIDFEELIFPDEIHDFLLRRDWVRAYSASAEFGLRYENLSVDFRQDFNMSKEHQIVEWRRVCDDDHAA